MKKFIFYSLILIFSLVNLASCSKDRGGDSAFNNDPYWPGGPVAPGQPGVWNSGQFEAVAQVMNRDLYRRYLQGDFCAFRNLDCRIVDSDPILRLFLPISNIPDNFQARGSLSLIIRSGYYYNSFGSSSKNYQLLFRRTQNNSFFEAKAIDYFTGNGIAQPLTFRGTGNPIQGTFGLQVFYGGQLMLQAIMYR